MSSSPAVLEIVKASAKRKDPESYTDSKLSQEIERLQKLRTAAHRLNQESARDAVASAEAKAPALIASNKFLSLGEIDELRGEIAVGSEVISRSVLFALENRLQLLRYERATRRTPAH